MAAGWLHHTQNVENAIRLPQHVPQRKQMPGGGQEQAGCPRPPPHTCCLERGSGPGMGGQKQPGLCHGAPSALSGPRREKAPGCLPPKGLGRPLGEEQKGLLAENLRATWIPQHGCCQGGAARNRQDKHWTSSDDQAASSKGPPFTEPQISPNDGAGNTYFTASGGFDEMAPRLRLGTW